MKPRSGQVRYTERALLQDAQEAMGGQIIRGLVELITNADDAYGEGPGKILIEITRSHGPWRVVVRDRARGLSAAEMEERLVALGGRTSGFEQGAKVRGNRGRGAKDLVAFGDVKFESIRDDKYSVLHLNQSGQWTLNTERATPGTRDLLGIKRNGMVVTVEVTENVRCPRFPTLRERLSNHYQLRDILSDPNRTVVLAESKRSREAPLRFAYPVLPVLVSEPLVVPGYPEVQAEIAIYQNAERIDAPASDECRLNGLLVKGAKAIYENTLFEVEGDPYSGWLSGRVVCSYVDALSREFDDAQESGAQHSDKNPQQIISRRRSGLEPTHPFHRALSTAASAVLRTVLARLKTEQAGQACESSLLRNSFDSLGQALGRLIDDDLKEIDEDEGLGGVPGGSNAPALGDLRIVPETIVLFMGEDKSVSVIAHRRVGSEIAAFELEPGGVVEVLDHGEKVGLDEHKRNPDLLVGQLHLRPVVEGGESLLTVRCGSEEAVAVVEVRGEREIAPPEVPLELEFDRETARIVLGKTKSLEVRAPADVVDRIGTMVRVTSSDAGIVVLGPPIELRFDEKELCYRGVVKVEGRRLGARAELVARPGDESARCVALVAQKDEDPKLDIRLENNEAGVRRVLVEVEGSTTRFNVQGLHAVLKRYLGPAPDFPEQNSDVARALIAEIVAGEATRLVMERKFPLRQSELHDAAGLYAEHSAYLSKYLARCHRHLLPNAAS